MLRPFALNWTTLISLFPWHLTLLFTSHFSAHPLFLPLQVSLLSSSHECSGPARLSPSISFPFIPQALISTYPHRPTQELLSVLQHIYSKECWNLQFSVSKIPQNSRSLKKTDLSLLQTQSPSRINGFGEQQLHPIQLHKKPGITFNTTSPNPQP